MSTLSSGSDSSLWVDYLENELEPPVRQDMDLLLSHSQTDQDIVSGLSKTKSLLAQITHIELPEEEEYYRRMHDKVMEKVMTKREKVSSKIKSQPDTTTSNGISYSD